MGLGHSKLKTREGVDEALELDLLKRINNKGKLTGDEMIRVKNEIMALRNENAEIAATNARKPPIPPDENPLAARLSEDLRRGDLRKMIDNYNEDLEEDQKIKLEEPYDSRAFFAELERVESLNEKNPPSIEKQAWLANINLKVGSEYGGLQNSVIYHENEKRLANLEYIRDPSPKNKRINELELEVWRGKKVVQNVWQEGQVKPLRGELKSWCSQLEVFNEKGFSKLRSTLQTNYVTANNITENTETIRKAIQILEETVATRKENLKKMRDVPGTKAKDIQGAQYDLRKAENDLRTLRIMLKVSEKLDVAIKGRDQAYDLLVKKQNELAKLKGSRNESSSSTAPPPPMSHVDAHEVLLEAPSSSTSPPVANNKNKIDKSNRNSL